MEVQKLELVVGDIKGNREIAYALLVAEQPYFVNQNVIEEEGKLTIESLLTDEYYSWDKLITMIDEEKLRHLINIGQLFHALQDSIYTYNLSPNNLVFSRNGNPLFVFRGVKGQVPPYDVVSLDEFTVNFKAMIVSLLDKKTSYEKLIEGQSPFYKGKLFCETIMKAENLDEIISLLEEKYLEEREQNKEKFSRVPNKLVSRLKLTTLITSLIGFFSLVGVLYFLFFAMPSQQMISDLRLAFVHQDYSAVVSTVKNTDSKSLSQDDSYMVAYSVIKTEPLTEAQKTELSKISTQSNTDYLRYWVLIGQSKIDEAMDIASYLDDPQLLMYGLTKKIDEVQRNPNLTSEQRTEQLNNYKGKLEELKKNYLTPEVSKSNVASTESR
ncbi:type VII secretion protein EssB [Streptococcus infantis]|jgi:type VII secretion protein essB|uniref:Type VII secretion protein EssB n=1 Tax=Streptococcus infantis ATCC 700779 TaxID=889204 RepID=E8K2X3_9STRE|nr:type VII secretion protein EssB [Streptococcus infantis]EFX35836.1 type VII secretion protein EssB [Streptococcus infantis ATCC 700779]EIG40897.1 type VII secretion protein EssB [Streptococcus infantis ATCC 700779]SUN82504.1 ESAT-6 secretion system protein EssB [Streptococcus infantis]